MPNPEHQAITTIWRMEGARIIAGVARLTRDIGLAEELAGDALVAALETWPGSGIPDNPGAWLMATAKNRALDYLRRQKLQGEKYDQLGRELETQGAMTMPDYFDLRVAAEENPLGDDLLRLMFISCHPLLSTEARTALTLKLIGGLTTAEISRAMLVPETTVAQRIVRAKRTLAEAHAPFELPPAAELSARLASVLEVIYLVFNEGYTATSGEHWTRPELVDEALRLGRILAGLAPEIAEVHGLVALMELQASRLTARLDAGGAPVLLRDQDRQRWDRLLIRRGLQALQRAEQLGGSLGPYALQAAIAACHSRAEQFAATDWARIAALYDALVQVLPSPVVELNRAVAVSMAYGPAAALEIVDRLAASAQLQAYHWLPSVRGDLLQRLGRQAEARIEFERAAAMTQNARESALLLERAGLAPRGTSGT